MLTQKLNFRAIFAVLILVGLMAVAMPTGKVSADFSTFDHPDYYYANITNAPEGTYYRSAGFNNDGTKIIAQKSIGTSTEIVLMDADRSNELIISNGDSGTGDIYAYMNPFWSDDGTTIGFVEVHNANPNKVIAYDLASGIGSYIYEPIDTDVANPDFIGTSKTSIIFWAYGDVGGADLWTWDGITLTNITDTDDYKEYEPISNADGSVIIYWSGETTTESVNTTHTLTWSGGAWVKDLGFTPIPDTYWAYWTTPAADEIALTIMSTKDVAIYDNTGAFVKDLTGPGYSGGSVGGTTQWNFFGSMPEGPNGEYIVTSNADRGATTGRDILIANPRISLYVDPMGYDSNPGTPAAPFATIQKAIDEAVDGSTIHVAAGTYLEKNILINKSLTLIGDPGDASAGPGVNAPVIDGESAYGDAFLLANGVSNVTIKGFEIRNYASNDTGVGNAISAWVGSTSNITIQDNFFHDLGYNGILVGNDYSTNPIKWSDHTNWLVKANVIDNVHYIGFELTNTSSSTIEGNTIHLDSPDIGAIFSSARRSESGLTIKDNFIDGTPSTSFPVIYIYAWDFEMPNLNLDNVLIEGNTIATSGTPFQIYVRDIDTGTITNVTIEENNLKTVRNRTAATIDGSPNWWGSIDGPADGQISGDVTYDPWCGDVDCSFMLSENEDGDIVIPLGTSEDDIQDVIDSLSYGDTLILPAGLIAPVGGFTIINPGITIVLQDGTKVQGSSPCFTVNASFTTIKAESIGGAQCIPTSGSNGIDVTAGLMNIIIEGLEFVGTTGTDGIHFAGAITDVVIVDNWFHNFAGDGIEFTAQPTGTVDIQGNLFQDNDGLGINASTFTLVAEYNAWGDYDGPTGTNGDGVSANVDATPWTHVDLYLVSTNPDIDNWLNQVFVGEKITFNVKANLVNAMGAVFVLEYPSNLTIDTSAPGGQFESELLDGSVAGKLSFTGYQTVAPAISGDDLTLFSVTFNAVAPDKGLLLNLDETTDIFSMAPISGPSNNIYATALEDITSLDVITRPTLNIVGLNGPFVAGISHIITNETCNAATGGDWTESVAAPIEPDTIGWIRISDITIAEIASIQFLYDGLWYDFSVQDAYGGSAVQQDEDDVIARFGNYNFGMEVPVDWCDYDAFRVTFVNPGSHNVTVELYDMMDTPFDGIDPNDILLASYGPVEISIAGDFDITGTISMQGQTNRAGVPMTLTKQGSPVYGPFNVTSINVISNNITFTGVNGGIYEITTAQPRYLNVTSDLDKQFLVNAAYLIDALELKGGNAVWSDNVINTGDASLVGTWYGQVINNDADVNFSGKVDIFDLALVGGNFDLTSAMVYEDWLVPEFNGTVTGVFDDDGANIWGSVSGDYNLSIDGYFTGGGAGFAYFTGTVSGDFSGTVTGAVYERGTDPLYAIITGTGAQETVRLVGAFVKSGIDGHFEGEIITGPELPAVTDITITGPTTVVVGNTIDLNVTTTPADRWVIWSIHSNHTAYASIDQNGIVTGLQSFASPIEVIVVVVDDSGFSTKSYWVTVTE